MNSAGTEADPTAQISTTVNWLVNESNHIQQQQLDKK